MISDLYPWAGRLTPQEASAALAAASILTAKATTRAAALDALQGALAKRGALRLSKLPRMGSSWRLPLDPLSTARCFMRAWSDASRRARPSLALPASRLRRWPAQIGLDGLAEALAPLAPAAIIVHVPGSRRRLAVHTPLRIAVIGDPDDLGLSRALGGFDDRVRWVRPGPDPVDLLVAGGSGGSALGELESWDARAEVVVLMGRPSERLDVELQVLETARLMAHAVVAVRAQPADPARWVADLVEPDDERTSLIERLWRAEVVEDRPAPLVLADAGSVAGDEEGTQTMVARRSREPRTFMFDPLSTLDPAPPQRTERAPDPRALRARLRAGSNHGVSDRLRPSEHHLIEVSVGAPDPGWFTDDSTFPAIDDFFDDLIERRWHLRVVAWDPVYLPEPQVAMLWLPAAGESATVSFELTVPADPRRPLGCRITVLHHNRVLQTGTLAETDGVIGWRIDAAPDPTIVELDEAHWFDASLVVNHDSIGVPRVTVFADDHIGLVALEPASLDRFAHKVRAELETLASFPDLYDDDVEADTMAEWLAHLAQEGSVFYDSLIAAGGLDRGRLAAAARIQIVSARLDAFFPGEFLYTYPAPRDDARLCPRGRALLTSDVDMACPGPHGRGVVCPLGFWNLSKVVERHAYRPADARPDGWFSLHESALASHGGFDPLERLLVAASDKVDGFEQGALDAMLGRVRRVAGVCEHASDWDDWAARLDRSGASLLVLLPHHNGKKRLEIGHGSAAPAALIGAAEVRPHATDPAPAVLLMGCETVGDFVGFDSFVTRFYLGGASVVVCTYGTVLGRHAAPATARLLELLDQRLGEGPVRMGDILLVIRRRLLSEGIPMALGLTSYGDADTLFERR